MDPPFGQSNIYFRARNLLRKCLKIVWKALRGYRPPKPTLGKVWLRLSYFEDRLIRLDAENREIFVENFYHSARQVNYITFLSVFIIIATYLATFQFRMIGFWEGLTVQLILVFSLFYIVWYYRMGMEDLMDYLIRTETTPDYAFRPRLGFRKTLEPVPPGEPAVKKKGKSKKR